MNILPRTNIKVALDKTRANELSEEDQENALKSLFRSFEIGTTNSFKFNFYYLLIVPKVIPRVIKNFIIMLIKKF